MTRRIIVFLLSVSVFETVVAASPPAPRGGAFPWLEIPPLSIDASSLALARAVEELRLKTPHLADVRAAVRRDWARQYTRLFWRIRGEEPLPYDRNAGHHFDAAALIEVADRDPLDVVLRRTVLLLENLRGDERGLGDELAVLAEDLRKIASAAGEAGPKEDTSRREALYLAACAVRRRIALSNPRLDFDRMLFIARGTFAGSRKTGETNTDATGGHFATQYFAFNTRPGGGLYFVANLRGPRPEVVNLLEEVPVANGRLAGKTLTYGAVLSPDLSYDGRTILFAHTENDAHNHNQWTTSTTWNLFKLELEYDRSDTPVPVRLSQLTDGPYNDFDPCWLPGGRIAFISERRGGYIRCFGRDANNIVPTYVLHSMKPDGSDLYPISFFETSEWHPSVNNEGKLVYTRWDYTDRENCLGSNFWICYPDGRDPRAPHGNYPTPYETFSGAVPLDGRIGRPYTEMSIRAIPGSPKYVFTAAPHHGEAFGALCVLDLRIEDDRFMSQIRKLTPYVPFPESQIHARSHYPYGTPWPLSEDFYLVNYWEDICLLDRYGNRELLVENGLCPHDPHGAIRLCDPIPLAPRPGPPVIPEGTTQSEDFAHLDRGATIGVMNVYDTDLPLPENTTIKWLRVTQNILKTDPWMNEPFVGYGTENTPRIPLGIVPVEADGSVFFEAPPGKELMFQLLDKNKTAVHSMRAVAYVHPGETLTCAGCHEKTHGSPSKTTLSPLAFTRPPSQLEPELNPVEPLSFYRHVAPVLHRACAPCHAEKQKPPQTFDHASLAAYVFHFDGGMRGAVVTPMFGGSRTIPGHLGARMSRLSAILDDEHHGKTVTAEDRARLRLWMDLNGPRLGSFSEEERQKQGELVWPLLDVDPENPVGLPSGGSYNTGLDTHTHPSGDYKTNRAAEEKRLGLR